jgi:4a-hydroxytetrahydrobiopterin dehydratase
MADASATQLAARTCQACTGQTPALSQAELEAHRSALPDWQCNGTWLEKHFRFKDYHQVMAFANAVAWIAHQQNHHPVMELGYRQCVVRWTTHAIGALSINDVICAAKVDQLLTEGQ